MLQPRKVVVFLALCLFLDLTKGLDEINTSPRRRRENGKDVTTVLLVDNHGRSTFGRFHSVKPDLGLITSTARTFIQEGVTTEYATQVLGTTLDNGRLYAHLLTKSSRVLYDNDSPTKSYDSINKKWNLENNVYESKGFVRNTDFISPHASDPVIVLPTISLNTFVERNDHEETSRSPKEIIEEEILKESPSNNFRVPYDDDTNKHIVLPLNQNIKIFKINPQMKDLSYENIINHKEIEKPVEEKFTPSKVRGWDNLPTFTVRNEFSPSGYSFLDDLPEFDINTERSKPTTVAERKAKQILFRAGLAKPNPKDLKSITYSGFAEFTTTVGDTVIIFTPHSTETTTNVGQVTKISVEATIEPTLTVKEPSIGTTVKTFLSHEPGMETKTVEGHKIEMKTSLPTMVIDKTDRMRNAKSKEVNEDEDEEEEDEEENMDAKSLVLAHEQNHELISTSGGKSTIIFSQDVIEPSESQIPMLSTPSDEDIAKIFASLQAAQAATSTEPLSTASTIFFEDVKETVKPSSGGATTIFFDSDVQIENTITEKATTTPSKIVEEPTTTEQQEITTNIITTEKLPETTTTEKQTTTTTTEKQTTTTEKQTTTTEKQTTTTQKQETTTNEVLTTSEQATTPEVSNEIESSDKEIEVVCTEGTKIVPTTAYRTLTYLTTFFIPQDNDETSTSVKSNEVISTEVSFQTKPCDDISPTAVQETTAAATLITTTEPIKTTTEEQPKLTTQEITTEQHSEEITTEHQTTVSNVPETTPQEITTERRHVTESEPETTEMTTEDGEELELLFKTLYTTYTYLTTYFQDSTSSVASRIVVTTNVITSTLDPSSMASDPAVAGLFEKDETSAYKSKSVTFDDFASIAPSKVADIRPTAIHSHAEEEKEVDGDFESIIARPTPILNDEKVLQTANGVKTYYTTYTYFTTIFVDGETEISSRTEVYTNFVTPSILASASQEILATKTVQDLEESSNDDDEDDDEESDDDNVIIKNRFNNLNVTPLNKYNSTISRQKTASPENNNTEKDIYTLTKDKLDNNILATSTSKEQAYVTLQRGTTTEENILENNILNLNDYETISTMVTDVRSSTSEGDKRIIDNVDKRNVLLDDQIVSESNNDSEIIPSPTLLLQTSYTTFTYFTTMYQGTTSSNVVSRLETVTNVVTQTLTPTHTLSVEDLSLPITYFTTFTYWTTLYKDGTTRTTSREETVSNIVTPSIDSTSGVPTISITPIVNTEATAQIEASSVGEEIKATKTLEIIPSVVGDDDLTTFFTTYTYYTTSYVGDSTVLNSRLETVTNVLNKSNDIDTNQIGRAIGSASQNQVEETSKTEIESTSTIKPTGLLSTIVNTVENSGITTVLSTDVFGTYIDGLYAKVLESTSSIVTETISPSSVSTENVKPTGVVSINQGKIVDAEGISTLFYTTQAIGTYIDNLYAQVIESTSSLTVDLEKKSSLGTDIPIAHKTGLVRLIEGSIVQNETTTLYESKVLGTVIDGRYAQIIESTSSFLVGKAASIQPSAVSDIAPTPTKAPDQEIAATSTISPSPVVIEGSISDSAKPEEETSTEENEGEEDDEKGNSRVKSRLTFQSRKRNFTPAIRPFASRQRPTFAPKRKSPGQSTATTVTRSDFTPTVTAVPAASKAGRFGGRRSSSSASNLILPTASGSRRFSRPKATSAVGGGGPSSSFGGGRRSSSRVQPTATGFGSSSRRAGFRSSSGGPIRASSLFPGSSRNRIRPTALAGLNRSPSSKSVTQTPPDGEDNELTTQVTDPTETTNNDQDTTLPISTTTEGSSRRSQNPLLRFKRPPLSRPSIAPKTATTPRNARSGNLNRNQNKGTTTAKPKVTYNRSNSLLNRPRPNALFPRRGLFTTTTTSPPEGEEDEEDLDEEGYENDSEEDTDYDSSKLLTQTATPPTTESTRKGRSSLVKPFVGFRRRSKRETTYSRFRRPTGKTTTAAPSEPETEAPKTRNRFAPKFRSKSGSGTTTSAPAPARKRISPSKPSSGRSQFTLREKDTSSSRTSVKRPTRPRGTSAPARKTSGRLRYQTEAPVRKQTSSRRENSRPAPPSRRGSVNYRQKQQQNDQIDENFVIPTFDGTITITHAIPTEVTIPVVNGKVTEYKNVVTAKYSTEVLDPQQYSTTINPYGKELKVLISESTEVAPNGATLITQFVLNESPTTSVIFTPTQIRGRKTSFSHVIPSTVYAVESVVNTIQPALAAQAPLANILLSQLLLGNLQPQNPLLGLQNPGFQQPTPSTELKTRATTYVTTVTSQMSTVIPLTFRGKEILTTIIDSSVTVVTATEFLTETVVVTPTFGLPGPQLNTLLLPLLQQHLAQPQALPQLSNNPPAGVINLNEPVAQALTQEPDRLNLTLDDEKHNDSAEEGTQSSRRKNRKKHHKKPAPPAPTEPPKETSVITLYVSGRTPGEFSTVLSTVIVGEENKRRKRSVDYIPVRPSKALDDLVISTLDYYDTYVMPATKEVSIEQPDIGTATESLESIIGDVSKHVTTKTPDLFNVKPTKSNRASKKYNIKYVKASDGSKKASGHFLA